MHKPQESCPKTPATPPPTPAESRIQREHDKNINDDAARQEISPILMEGISGRELLPPVQGDPPGTAADLQKNEALVSLTTIRNLP